MPLGAWDGVVLGGSPQRVTGLRMANLNLTGPIPPELGGLTGLTRLSLYSDGLTGAIPPELGNLSNLEGLHLGGKLTGAIPTELANLSNLKSLQLSGNQLTGDDPR